MTTDQDAHLSRKDRITFMRGACHHLARAILARLPNAEDCRIGLIVDVGVEESQQGLTDEELTDERLVAERRVDHVFVILPSGQAIDAMGLRSPRDVVLGSYWSGGEIYAGHREMDAARALRIVEALGWSSEAPAETGEAAETLLRLVPASGA